MMKALCPDITKNDTSKRISEVPLASLIVSTSSAIVFETKLGN